jgi:DNA invertase Pin-like site-specific DNA recombinase
MERDMIISRQKSSIERLREKNQRWGKGKLLSQERRDEILQLKEEGYSYRGICKKLGVSLGSVQYTIKNSTV